MKHIKFIAVPFILYFIYLSPVYASDLSREKRMADEIVDTIMDGDAVFLKADSHEFLGIYTEAEEAKGAVIILHGRGFHPDWQDTVNPLRVGLTEFGWNTLSVQMPVLEKQAKYYDYVPLFPEAIPRIDAAIKYVREQGNRKVVLVAHSCGVHMAMTWVDAWGDDKAPQEIDAYIGLGMGATDYQQFMAKPFPFDKLTVPALDVYGENDYPVIIREAPERLLRLKASGNKKTSQVMIEGADHYYKDKGEVLTRVIGQWLQTL
ncbi:MAG: DUF3530 family protein [Gammaproteobacteria bacterium]|nr:DUF3530 family protein [Gammaproteobacteria bacterium]